MFKRFIPLLFTACLFTSTVMAQEARDATQKNDAIFKKEPPREDTVTSSHTIQIGTANIPYQTTVIVQEFKEKTTLVKIRAEIIVHRESQKAIILGEGGKMIRKLGTTSREEIEKFLSGSGEKQKVFLELFVKVRDKWREREDYLREFGY